MFRLFGRDDLQGRMAGDLLAERFGTKSIAILDDGRVFGQGLAEEAVFEAIQPGQVDYLDVIRKMQAVEVLIMGASGMRRG